MFDPAESQSVPWQGTGAVHPAALRGARDGEILTLRDPGTGSAEIGIVAYSEQSGWRVAVSQEQRLLLKPVRDFTSIILLFGLLLLAGSAVVASRLAARLTVPLRRIHDALSGLDWSTVARRVLRAADLGLDELEELEAAFHDMQRKLRESMDEALEARAHEMKATLLALQSQMDPHFVYNMLTTIGIMAEEGMSGEIAESVENMTHLLRYISSGKSSMVSIAEELEYARRYLACMKVRFPRQPVLRHRGPPSSCDVKVPKLIIQPIIENTMKYGLRRPAALAAVHPGESGRTDDGRSRPGQRARLPRGEARELRRRIETRMRSAADPRSVHQRHGAAQHLHAPSHLLRGRGGLQDRKQTRREAPVSSSAEPVSRRRTYSVLVAEDEPLIRAEHRAEAGGVLPGLRGRGEAADGQEALEAIGGAVPRRAHHRHPHARHRRPCPDPRGVLRLSRDVKVVIVSGYDEFSYAKRPSPSA